MLEDIRNNITRLIALYEGERQRADGLAQSLAQSNASLDACRKQIDELNRQLDNLQLRNAFSADCDTRATKERLDRLIREIDKCIKLLER